MTTPRIFIFVARDFGGDVLCIALAEDGTVLRSHVCSNESFAKLDLGDSRSVCRDAYVSHYPDGYELEFVRTSDVEHHAGIRAATALNKAKKPLTTLYAERLAREFRPTMTHEVVLHWGKEAAAAILNLVAERDTLKARIGEESHGGT